MLSLRALAVAAFALTLAWLPTGVQAQSLTQALASAYTNNPELASAFLSVKSAAEDIALRQAGTRPTIGASLSGDYQWSTAGGQFNDSSSYTAGISYNQTIFDNFRTDAEIEQARALAELSKYSMRNTEQNVLLSVVDAYMSVVRDSQLVQLRQENVSFYEAQLQSSRDRLEVGEGTRIDVAQAEARLAQGVASHRAAIASLQTSQATYQRYVGTRPQSLSASHSYTGLVPPALDDALAQAEVQHPAILSAKASIRAAQAGSDAAQAGFGPSITLNGSVGTGLAFSSNPTALQGAQGVSGQVGISLTVPIYAGGAIGASVRKANIEQIRSEVSAMSAYDQVREAVITSWSGIQNASAQIESAQAAVAAQEQVVEGVIQERDLGASTTLDVLDAQAELTTQREGLIQATTNRVVATFSLLAATGRLSATELGLPVEIKSADDYTATVQDVWQELRTVD
ncbi:TolC family outer membrane protein [Devosia nitrariae]|uniref:Transporter n=1 Tax=Devosia nitrariae TaxID=2071872 RepID=A0ABQ5WCU9_9HYPH|nr:TolC family outer membrane protein [Devosia nitrariae]GLQ57906.1 transporter [Devosia nitrariae]